MTDDMNIAKDRQGHPLRHPLSTVFPDSEAAIKDITQSMQRNGFLKAYPILLYPNADGEFCILDGWHRFNAAQTAGVEPEFQVFEGSEAEANALVMASNLERRHLGKQAKAAAMLVFNKRLGVEHETSVAEIAATSGAAPRTIEGLSSLTAAELERVAHGESPKAVRGRSARARSKGKTNLVKMPLLKGQVNRLAAVARMIDVKESVVAKEAAELGVAAVEAKYREQVEQAEAEPASE